MNYKIAIAKKYLELFLMSPFVILGRLAGIFFPLKTHHRHFLIFPNADIGGSIKVNADILKLLQKEKPIIIFSKKPKNNRFRHLFEKEDVRILDLHKYIDIKWLHFINFFFRGLIASWINAAQNPIVFGGESMFFYKIIPHVKKGAKSIDLCHVNTWFNYSIAFANKIETRILSTPKIKRDLEEVYLTKNVPQKYLNRLILIDNKVDIPTVCKQSYNKTLQVLYVGRGVPQKRVHLIAGVAKKINQERAPIHFSFVGDVDNIIPSEVQNYCTLYGTINDEQQLYNIYENADVLILTSSFEGLPIVVMDMMARGKVVLSTNVDGIPDYITNRHNGLLIFSKSEEEIIDEAVNQLKWVIQNPDLFTEIGNNAFQFAQSHFSNDVFKAAYSRILF